MDTTAPAVATDKMLAHSLELDGSHDHVKAVVSSGSAAWTNRELQEFSSVGIATTDTAPIVVVVEVVVDVDVVVEVVVVEVVVEEVVSVLMVVVVVQVVTDDVPDAVDTLVVLVMLNVVVVDVIVSVMLSNTGVLKLSTVSV